MRDGCSRTYSPFVVASFRDAWRIRAVCKLYWLKTALFRGQTQAYLVAQVGSTRDALTNGRTVYRCDTLR